MFFVKLYLTFLVLVFFTAVIYFGYNLLALALVFGLPALVIWQAFVLAILYYLYLATYKIK